RSAEPGNTIPGLQSRTLWRRNGESTVRRIQAAFTAVVVVLQDGASAAEAGIAIAALLRPHRHLSHPPQLRCVSATRRLDYRRTGVIAGRLETLAGMPRP